MTNRTTHAVIAGVAAITIAWGAAVGFAAPAKSPKNAKRVTSAQAESVVLHRFHGKIVGKSKLENEEGKWQYGVMVRSGHTLREVMVGAYSGKIEDVEVTTAAKERVEAKADQAASRHQ